MTNAIRCRRAIRLLRHRVNLVAQTQGITTNDKVGKPHNASLTTSQNKSGSKLKACAKIGDRAGEDKQNKTKLYKIELHMSWNTLLRGIFASMVWLEICWRGAVSSGNTSMICLAYRTWMQRKWSKVTKAYKGQRAIALGHCTRMSDP